MWMTPKVTGEMIVVPNVAVWLSGNVVGKICCYETHFNSTKDSPKCFCSPCCPAMGCYDTRQIL